MTIQAKVPPALAALHNLILDLDPYDIDEYLSGDPQSDIIHEDDLDPNPGQPQDNEFGWLANGAVTRTEKNRAIAARNHIADVMWRDYQQVQENRRQELNE